MLSNVNSVLPPVPGLLAGKAETLQNGDGKRPELAQEAARQFESIFMSILLKEMRQSIGDGGLFAGDSSDVFGGMFDLYMGEHLANSTNLGVSDLVNKQLEKYSNVQNQENAQQRNT